MAFKKKTPAKRRYKKRVRTFKRRGNRIRKGMPEDMLKARIVIPKPFLFRTASAGAVFVFPWCSYSNPMGNDSPWSVGMRESSEFLTWFSRFQYMKVTYAKVTFDVARIDIGGNLTILGWYEQEIASRADGIWPLQDVSSINMRKCIDFVHEGIDVNSRKGRKKGVNIQTVRRKIS